MKRPERFKILFLALSFFLVSCGSGPKVATCVSDGDLGFDCVDHDGRVFRIPYQMSEGYVAYSPEDLELLVNYFRNKCDD